MHHNHMSSKLAMLERIMISQAVRINLNYHLDLLSSANDLATKTNYLSHLNCHVLDVAVKVCVTASKQLGRGESLG